jgi:esterase/lipase
MSAFRQLWNFVSRASIANELGERHQPSGCDDSYHLASESIEAYLAAARQQVSCGRLDLDGKQDAWIIEGNSPFTLVPAEPARRAILMVHGLTDSPFALRDLAKYFQARGFFVLAMQLPGHGTRPGDLLDFSWQHVLNAHQQLLELLQARFESVYAMGFSAGATLSIYQSMLNPLIQGLFLFSPALKLSPLAGLTGAFGKTGKRWPGMAWFDVQPDTDCFKYESLTNRAIAEVHALTRAVQRVGSLSERRIPVFVAASEQDATLDTQATLDWFSGLTGPRRMLLYTTGTPSLPDFVQRVNSVFPDQHIRSFSHTSIIQSPDNPHYGRRGRQRSCAHYYRLDPIKYARCRAGEEDCLGEMFAETADCRVIRRLTYNPLYAGMLDEMNAFLEHHCGIKS